MEKLIEQTLSKPTLQFGLKPENYLVLVLVASVGIFFMSKLYLISILVILIMLFRYVNLSKQRYFWSSIYLWFTTNRNLHLNQTKELPPLFKD